MKRLLCLAIFLIGCACPPSKAEILTYQVIGKEYFNYVKSDDTLDKKKKERRYRSLKSWRIRLELPDSEDFKE